MPRRPIERRAGTDAMPRTELVSHAATMRTGPLGSTIHVLRADAATSAALAALDGNRGFRRVCAAG